MVIGSVTDPPAPQGKVTSAQKESARNSGPGPGHGGEFAHVMADLSRSAVQPVRPSPDQRGATPDAPLPAQMELDDTHIPTLHIDAATRGMDDNAPHPPAQELAEVSALPAPPEPDDTYPEHETAAAPVGLHSARLLQPDEPPVALRNAAVVQTDIPRKITQPGLQTESEAKSARSHAHSLLAAQVTAYEPTVSVPALKAAYDLPFGNTVAAPAPVYVYNAEDVPQFPSGPGRPEITPIQIPQATVITAAEPHLCGPALARKDTPAAGTPQVVSATTAPLPSLAGHDTQVLATQPQLPHAPGPHGAFAPPDEPDLPPPDDAAPLPVAGLGASETTAGQTARPVMPVLRGDGPLPSALAQALHEAAQTGETELDLGDRGRLRLAVSALDGSVQISMLSGRTDMLDQIKRSLHLLLDDLTALGFQKIDLKLVDDSGGRAMHRIQVTDGIAEYPAPAITGQHGAPPGSIGMDIRL
ncbi:hypothetical protein [Roseinatronobacter alkalisoli]|uniref:Flagellar hook-length control protein FliK n=1 Tax=Roseinatronobacter alkalisoli TaxID=3028235 RepID=A0ABT5TAH7_9RHOB|nr:hypothetical protein [Roseinatronobacter sp. HJB301]MDD7971735.1 hypothetical protein [Roseinatronobacter sp. HJB301]